MCFSVRLRSLDGFGVLNSRQLHISRSLYLTSRAWKYAAFTFIRHIDGTYFHPEKDFNHCVLRIYQKRCKDKKYLNSVTLSEPNIRSSKANPLCRIVELPYVKELNLSWCQAIQSIELIRQMTSLQSLILSSCFSVHHLSLEVIDSLN
jgi:hypothetical protein